MKGGALLHAPLWGKIWLVGPCFPQKEVSFTWMARSTTRHLWKTTGPPLRTQIQFVDEHLSFTLFHADLVTLLVGWLGPSQSSLARTDRRVRLF